MATEILLIAAKIILNLTNLELMRTLSFHLSERYYMKLKLLTMIEPKLAEQFKEPDDMPHLHVFDASNLARVQTLYEFINVFQRKFYNRSVIYASFFIVVYSMQAVYVLVMVTVFQAKLSGDLAFFTINAFCNTGIYAILFAIAIYSGGQANHLDFVFQ